MVVIGLNNMSLENRLTVEQRKRILEEALKVDPSRLRVAEELVREFAERLKGTNWEYDILGEELFNKIQKLRQSDEQVS